MSKLKDTVKTVDKEGKELILDVKRPSSKQTQEAQLVYAAEWGKAVERKALLREKLDDVLREQKIWDDAKEVEFQRLRRSILEGIRKIKTGGIPLRKDTEKTLSARSLAFQIKKDREDLQELLSQRNRIDSNTAEALADNMRFNYLVSVCTVYNKDGLPYYKNLDDYIENMSEKASIDAATKLANLIYGLDENYEDSLPEVQFLKKFKFIDNKGKILNEKQQRVDSRGKLIDEDDNYINEKGEKVDEFGNRLDDKGEYLVDFQPFLDDDGKPIPEPVQTSTEKKSEPKLES
jgi:hypothetical protein